MAKFYATCGSQTLTIAAASAQHAAMRLLDEALAAHVWIYEDDTINESDRRDHIVLEALLHLSPTVLVSERGVGRADAGEFGVPELLDQWHRLMMGLSAMIEAVGLSERRLLPDQANQSNGPGNPR